MKIMKKTLCVFLSVLMLFSALSVSLVAFAEDISYRELAYSFFKHRTVTSGLTSTEVVETDDNGFPVTSIVGDMDYYELSNSSADYTYADDNEKPIRAIAYDHKVTAKDNSSGVIRAAVTEYLAIADKLMSKEYGVGLYTIPMIAEEVSNALMFTKGDNGEYLFLDGYTYVEDAVGKIVGRSPEKTYRVVDGEVEELNVSDSWMKEYGEGHNFITLYEYCNVATIIDYFSGNCTSVNSGSWFHNYTFYCYTDIDTVLSTETLVNSSLAVRHLTVEWSMKRQFDDAGIEPQYYNGGYLITEDITSTSNIRQTLSSMRSDFNSLFQKFYNNDYLKTVTNSQLIASDYNEVMRHYETFSSLSNAAMLNVFGQSAYSYMHLVNQLTPIVREDLPANPLYWPKHTYEKYQDESGNNVVYQVDAYGVTSIVSTIDALLTNEKLGGIVKSFLTLSDPIKAQQAKTPKDVLYQFASEMLFQDNIVNMLLDLVYPMVSELIDGMLTEEFMSETLGNLTGSFIDGLIESLINGIANTGDGWQGLIYGALIGQMGVALTPAGVAYVWNKDGYLDPQYGYTTTFPELQNMHNMLKEAKGGEKTSTAKGFYSTGDYYAIGTEPQFAGGNTVYCGDRWRDVDSSKLVWGINGDREKFLKALDLVLAPLVPLLAVVLGNVQTNLSVGNLLGTQLIAILSDLHLYNDVLLPLFETLGIPGLKSGTDFERMAQTLQGQSTRTPPNIAAFLNDGILNPILNWVTEVVLADPITTVLNLVPNISYYLTSGALMATIESVNVPIGLKFGLLELTGDDAVYTLNIMELIGKETLAFLDSLQGIIDLIGIDVDTGIPIVGYHAEGQTGVFKPGQAGYNPDIHNIPVSEAYISSAGNMSLYQDSYEYTTLISGLDANGNITEYAVCNEIGWKNDLGFVVTERDEAAGDFATYHTAVRAYYQYTVTTGEGEDAVSTTYRVADKSMLPSDILESGDYSHERDVVTLSAEAQLPPIMDYKLQAIGTIKTTESGRYTELSTHDGVWAAGYRKYIDMHKEVINIYDNNKPVQMETTGLVLLFLFRYIFSALMYRPYSGSSFTSDYTLLDAFGLDDETLNDELIPGLRLKDIIDNVALHPDEAIAALLELLYKNEDGSKYVIDENGNVQAGKPYKYKIEQIDYHTEEIISAAEANNDYSYGTAILYTEKWTKDKSEYIVDNLDDIVEDVFAMLKMDGMDSLGGFLEDLVGEMLFTNDMLSDLASMLYGLLADLGGDIDILGILDAALGVQMTKSALANALLYEFGDAVFEDSYELGEDGNIAYQTDEDGNIVYETDENGEIKYVPDENGNPVPIPIPVQKYESVYSKLAADSAEYDKYKTAADTASKNAESALNGDNMDLYNQQIAIYNEQSALAAEVGKFTDSAFYKFGTVEGEEELVNLYALDWGYKNPAIKAKYSDAEIFLRAASAILSPFAILIKFIFMGDDLMLLRREMKDEDGNVITDANGNAVLSDTGLVNIPSYEVYHYAWIPLMETLGATDGLISFRSYFEKVFATRESSKLPAGVELATAQNCDAIYYLVSPIIGLAENVFENPIDVVLNLLPNLLFFISIGGLNDVINNIAHFAYVLLDILSPLLDAYPVVNSLLANIRIGEVALNISLPLDFDFNQLVNQLLEGLLGEALSFDIENENLVIGKQDVEKEVFVPTLDAEGNEQHDEDGNVIGTMEWQTVTEDVYAVGTLNLKLPYIDFTTLCAGTVVERLSVAGYNYLYLDTGGGADLITLIFRLVTDTLFYEENAENLAEFLIGFSQLDDEDDNDDLLMEIFTYLNMKANEADAPDIVMNILYYIIKFLVPIADELGSRFKRVDFSIVEMFEDLDNITVYISALMDDGGPPNPTLSGFQRLIQLIKEFFAKIGEFFRMLFGG